MGSWLDTDGLYRQYGPTKAVPTTAGDYLSYGETREIETTLTLANYVPAGVFILANTTFIPSGVFIETVELDTEVAAAGGTSISLGTMRADRVTPVSAVSFGNIIVTATLGPAGTKLIYNVPSAGNGGTALGTVTSFPDGFAYPYITSVGTFTNGVIKFRIKYRTTTNITQ